MKRPTSQLFALFFGACAMTSSVLLSSCGKDDEENILPDVEIPTEFSDLTVEQNKANLEDNGIELIGKMTSLKNASGIKTTISLNHFLTIAEIPGGRAATNNKAVKMMILLSKFGIGKAKASEVLKGFRTKEDDPSTAQEVFDDYKGTYTYNSATEEWDYVAGGDKIVFKFPSTENGTTNNAELAIYGYTSKPIVNEESEYEGDAPTALKADLSVNGTKQIEYSWAASYKNNGEPTSIVTSITIGAFKFAFELVNITSQISVDYGLTENGSNLISFGVGAKGNFTSGAIDEGPGDAVTYSTAYFQIMNIKFAGEIEISKLTDALDDANTIEEQADAYNENVTLVAFYADNKKKIADTEFYSTTKTDSWEYCWEEDGVEVCETYESDPYEVIDIRLVFADGSPVDLAAYTNEGFESLETELNEFKDDLDEDIGG